LGFNWPLSFAGEVKIKYSGSGMITRGSYKEITGPCPRPNSAGRYKISVRALDGNDIVVGTGSKERLFPEKNNM
jgi:hypothetical protein